MIILKFTSQFLTLSFALTSLSLVLLVSCSSGIVEVSNPKAVVYEPHLEGKDIIIDPEKLTIYPVVYNIYDRSPYEYTFRDDINGIYVPSSLTNPYTVRYVKGSSIIVEPRMHRSDTEDLISNIKEDLVFKRFDKALTLYDELIQKDASCPKNLTLKAHLLMNLKKTSEAIPLFQKALEVNPVDAQAHYWLSLCFMENNSFDKAYQHNIYAILFDVNNIQYWDNLNRVNPFHQQSLKRTEFPFPILLEDKDKKNCTIWTNRYYNSHWEPYAINKAVWFKDSGYRVRRTGLRTYYYYPKEELESLVNTLFSYAKEINDASKAGLSYKELPKEDTLDKLLFIANKGFIQEYILLEIIARQDPYYFCDKSEMLWDQISAFIKRFYLGLE